MRRIPRFRREALTLTLSQSSIMHKLALEEERLEK